MKLKELQKNWDEFGRQDPLWSILTNPTKKGNKWKLDDFFNTGQVEIESIIKYIESLGIPYSQKRALDFGCGVGRLTQALCQHFNECYGVDIAPSMIELAKQYNCQGNKCKYYLNEQENLSLFENNFFDFIYSKIVLQHMKPEYSKNYIRELVRVLAPGGLLVFQIPSELAPANSLDVLEDSAYQAQITLHNPPITAKAGTQTTILVKVKNVSNVTWPSFKESNGKYCIGLGNHWLDEFGNLIINDDGREPLPKSLNSMQEIDILLTITVPTDPGSYILELDMVHEHVAWFRNKGSEIMRIPVQVEGRNRSMGIGQRILNFCRRLTVIDAPKDSSPFFVPRMEMYSIQKNVVLELIGSSGGKVIDVQQDFSAGQGFISYLYCVTKE